MTHRQSVNEELEYARNNLRRVLDARGIADATFIVQFLERFIDANIQVALLNRLYPDEI